MTANRGIKHRALELSRLVEWVIAELPKNDDQKGMMMGIHPENIGNYALSADGSMTKITKRMYIRCENLQSNLMEIGTIVIEQNLPEIK